MVKLFAESGEGEVICFMGYLHCCGSLHKTRTFMLVPAENFTICELDILQQCPVCGHYVVQLTRIDKNNNISTIRHSNSKARKFFEKIKSKILYEEKFYDYSKNYHTSFYLNYNEYGVKKRCYSNISNLKLGKI